jgi:hypothetical protein
LEIFYLSAATKQQALFFAETMCFAEFCKKYTSLEVLKGDQ